MLEDACPICAAKRTLLEARQGLERRRFPRGRMACLHEDEAWHLRLENALRELSTCTSQMVRAALLEQIAFLKHTHTPQMVVGQAFGVHLESA